MSDPLESASFQMREHLRLVHGWDQDYIDGELALDLEHHHEQAHFMSDPVEPHEHID